MDAGAQGSRTSSTWGTPQDSAARRRKELLRHAANMLEAAEADLEVVEGRGHVKGVPDRE